MGSDLGFLDVVAGLSVLGGCLSKLPRVIVVLLSVSCLCVLWEESLLRWVDLRRDLDLLDDLFSRVKGDLWLFLGGRSSGSCWACWTKSGGVGGLALMGTSTGWLPCWSPGWNGVGTLVVDASNAGAGVSWVLLVIGAGGTGMSVVSKITSKI